MCEAAKIAYVRVSTAEQNEERQIEALKKYGIDKWYIEKVSGKDADRPKLKEMLDYVRADDTVYIHDLSRLARSTKDLLEMVDKLKAKGVYLVSNKENIDSSTPVGRLMLTMIGAIYEFERTNMLERQKEGIQIKKEQDKLLPPEQRTYKGRKAITFGTEDFRKEYERYLHREISKPKLASILNISRPTLDKLIKKYNEEGKL